MRWVEGTLTARELSRGWRERECLFRDTSFGFRRSRMGSLSLWLRRYCAGAASPLRRHSRDVLGGWMQLVDLRC